MMKKWMLTMAAVASMGLLAGCSSEKTVNVVIDNMAFNTNQIILKTGVPVKLVLVNNDGHVHDLSVDTIPVVIKESEEAEPAHAHSHEEKEPDLHVSAGPGQKGVVEFTPTEAGTYTFVCTVDGHEELGMKGTIVVSADGKLPKVQ